MIDDTCPQCGSETTCDEIDIGVGTMHSPSWCSNCGWKQEEEIRELMKELGLEEVEQ